MERKGAIVWAVMLAAQLLLLGGAAAPTAEQAAAAYKSGRLGTALVALELGEPDAAVRLLRADDPASLSPAPTVEPAFANAADPSAAPTAEPTIAPTAEPTAEPTPKSTPEIVPFTDDTGVEIRNKTSLEADIAALMAEPLTQTLPAEGAQILIIHTHGTEAYFPAPGEEYTPSDPFRTTDAERSVIRVGDALQASLESYGLRVLHDRTLYDYPSYAGSYERAAAAIESILAENPGIALVLDVHRDAIGDDATVYKTCAAGSGMAQVMLVCGTDEYLEHPLWRENLKLALCMQAAAVSANGTLMRPIHLAPERYNQQYTTGSLIVEVGTNGNTLSEAVAAAGLFGAAVGEMLASLVAPG